MYKIPVEIIDEKQVKKINLDCIFLIKNIIYFYKIS